MYIKSRRKKNHSAKINKLVLLKLSDNCTVEYEILSMGHTHPSTVPMARFLGLDPDCIPLWDLVQGQSVDTVGIRPNSSKWKLHWIHFTFDSDECNT